MSRRNRQPPPILPTSEAAAAMISSRPGNADPRKPPGPLPPGTNGWRNFGHGQHASDQIGAFAGQRLTQRFTMLPGVQLICGREHANSRWYYPMLTVVPTGSTTQNQRGGRPIGALLYGSRYTGGIGPNTMSRFQPNVAAAQIRQSGLRGLLGQLVPGKD